MMRRFVRLVRPEGGLNMLGGALFLALTMVLSVGTFDFAVFVARVHNAQWEAEGMALAAAKPRRQKPNQEDALRAARDWASLNNVDPSRIECCTVGDLRPLAAPDGYADTVTVTTRATQGTFFLRFLSIPGTISVRRSATAQVVGAGGGPICPWGVGGDPSDVTPEDGSYLGLISGRVFAIDLAAAPRGPGDFLPLDLSGSGVAGYQETIARGCLAGEAPGVGPPGGYSPYLQPPWSECVRGTLDGGAGRIVLVPVVSRPPDDPGGVVRVLGLAAMYIVSWDRADTSSAGTCEVYGMFLSRSSVDAIDLVGEDDNPLAPLRIVLIH